MIKTLKPCLRFCFDRERWRDAKKDIPPISFTCTALFKQSLPPHLRYCDVFLDYLEKNPKAAPFLLPVSSPPEYHDVVKHPMDISTIRKKILASQYADLDAFKGDVDLMWDNCVIFNGTDSPIGRDAQKLKDYFDFLWRHVTIKDVVYAGQFADNLERGQNGVEEAYNLALRFYQFPDRPLIPPLEKITRPVVVEKREVDKWVYPMPSDEELRKQMSFEEKHNMAKTICLFPPELLGEVITLLQKEKNFSKDAHINIPFSEISNSTLRHIQAYIREAKKAEGLVKKMHQKETRPASEQLIFLEKLLEELNDLMKKKRLQYGVVASDTTTDGTTDADYDDTEGEYSSTEDESST